MYQLLSNESLIPTEGTVFCMYYTMLPSNVSTVLCFYKVVALEGAFCIFASYLLCFLVFCCHHRGFLMYFHWLQSETTPINATKSHISQQRACSYKRVFRKPLRAASSQELWRSIQVAGGVSQMWTKTEFLELGLMNLLSP